MKRTEQMGQEYRAALDGLRFSEQDKGRMVEELMAGREVRRTKRRALRPLRAALVAACLCLALAGTALAVAPEAVAQLIERLTVRVYADGEDNGYHVGGGTMTKYPLSDLSEALNAASEARDGPGVVQLRFDRWDEVQAFLGEDVPCVWPNGGRDWDSPFYVYLFHVEIDRLWGVDINSVDVDRGEVYIHIRTEHWRGEEVSTGLNGDTGAIQQLGSYPMANGSVAELVGYLGPEEFPHAFCSGHFMKDGILYDVTAFGTVPTYEEAEAQLKVLLDSFE